MILTPLDGDLLLRKLNEYYPIQHPRLNDKEREIWFKAGQSSVVEKLKQMKDNDWAELYGEN